MGDSGGGEDGKGTTGKTVMSMGMVKKRP